jgi:GntR family transcriptional regulator of vanillate catabolism
VIARSHDDHHRIAESLIAGQATRAENLMREHVHFAGLFLRENFHRVPPGEAPSHELRGTNRGAL